jgi:hypothetical protein
LLITSRKGTMRGTVVRVATRYDRGQDLINVDVADGSSLSWMVKPPHTYVVGDEVVFDTVTETQRYYEERDRPC